MAARRQTHPSSTTCSCPLSGRRQALVAVSQDIKNTQYNDLWVGGVDTGPLRRWANGNAITTGRAGVQYSLDPVIE